jgi:hypothetical protein
MFAKMPPKKLRAREMSANSSILLYLFIKKRLKPITDVLPANLKKVAARFQQMQGILRMAPKSVNI